MFHFILLKSDRKGQEPDDFIHVKCPHRGTESNRWTNKTNQQKLPDTANGVGVTGGKERES